MTKARNNKAGAGPRG